MSGPSAAAPALFARRARWHELRREPPLEALRIHVLATYTADPLVPYLGLGLHEAGMPASFTVATANQIVQQLLDQDGDVARSRPDVIVVAPRFEDMTARSRGDVSITRVDELSSVADV